MFALCATIKTLFEGSTEPLAGRVLAVLEAGLAPDPGTRPLPTKLAQELRALLSEAEPVAHVLPPAGATEQPPPPAEFWCEGLTVDFRKKTLRVITPLGSGGVGYTFKVEHVDRETGENYGTYVAKVIRTREAGTAAIRAYNRVRSRSTHPGLAAVFEVDTEWAPDRVLALLKWVEGDSLDTLRGVLPLVVEECGEDSLQSLLERWLREACEALAVLHSEGLVHGDVSPRNLIYHRGGLVLTDYDLVTPAGQPAWGIGARAYCSPEAEQRQPLQPSDDIFALAASLFEVVFDRQPFTSQAGALDKTKGLDWQPSERETLGPIAEFFDLATHPDRTRRFKDAMAALNWLKRDSVTPVTTPAEPVVSIRSKSCTVPWLENVLQLYPGSPHGNVETRGLDSKFAADTYVETGLEKTLYEELRQRRIRLLILCGNAGDGKTALLQKLAAMFGIDQVHSAKRIWESRTSDGLFLRANLDGAAAWQGRSANQLLDEFFEPFLNGPPADDRAHLLAINDGRLLEWLQLREQAGQVPPLIRSLLACLAKEDDPTLVPDYIRFLSLNHRSLVGGCTGPGAEFKTDFLDNLILALLGRERAPEIWQPCPSCPAFQRCTAGQNAHRLIASFSDSTTTNGLRGRRLRERLAEAFQAVHFRGQVHITTRELRGALSYILFGVNTCHEIRNGLEAPAMPYWDMAFDPQSPFRQGELLRELSRLDPALEANPPLDRWLVGRSSREISGAGPAYPGLSLASARRRAYFEWLDSELEAAAGSAAALGLAGGHHLDLFRRAALGDADSNRDICAKLCLGISKLEQLPPQALARPDLIPFRIPARTPTETIFWVAKPLARFRLEPDWPPVRMPGFHLLPNRLRLVYQGNYGHEEVLNMGYELFHTLLSLAEGEQLAAQRSDDLFAHLQIFVQRIAREDEAHLFAWHPKDDQRMYRISVRSDADRQQLVCEPL